MVRSPERGDSNEDYDGDRNMSPSDREEKSKSSSSSLEDDWKNRGNSLHVAGFGIKLKDDELKEKFISFGKIVECIIMIDPNTKISRGFGFITYTNPDEAEEAIRTMDGTKIDGNVIKVSKSKRSKPRDSTPGAYMGNDRKKRMTKPYNHPYPYPYPTKYPPYPPPYGGGVGYYGYGSYPYQYPAATGYGKSNYDQARYSPYMRVDSSSRYDRSRDYDSRDRDRSDRDRDRSDRDRDRDRDHYRRND